MSLDHMPSFFSFLARSTPFVFIGTMISDLLLCAGASLVFARQHIQSACMPFVIHIFVPVIT